MYLKFYFTFKKETWYVVKFVIHFCDRQKFTKSYAFNKNLCCTKKFTFKRFKGII